MRKVVTTELGVSENEFELDYQNEMAENTPAVAMV